jgi:hypothetical protein
MAAGLLLLQGSHTPTLALVGLSAVTKLKRQLPSLVGHVEGTSSSVINVTWLLAGVNMLNPSMLHRAARETVCEGGEQQQVSK